ncbi:hypothetical protein [Hydrogenophaga sp.]|uniref:hypothetical protein n=1 Tax=Hydrogenophaga sp. TaxID=1904254 RepID=UPI002634A5BE|nr:hypothetical protein [Hydrogenophaga sp.]MCW5655543.1 hypothetical protein [Hydrogenophaga sp.]
MPIATCYEALAGARTPQDTEAAIRRMLASPPEALAEAARRTPVNTLSTVLNRASKVRPLVPQHTGAPRPGPTSLSEEVFAAMGVANVMARVGDAGAGKHLALALNAASHASAPTCQAAIAHALDSGSLQRLFQTNCLQDIAQALNAASKADADTCQRVVTLAGETGALRRVFQNGNPQDIAQALNAASKTNAGTCQRAVALAGETGALRRVFQGGTPQAVANALNAAGKVDVAICQRAVTLAGETGALRRVFQDGTPQAVANALNAASKADVATCQRTVALAGETGALRRVFQDGDPQAVANTLNAASKVDIAICQQAVALAGETGALRRVFQDGDPQDIANALNAASKAGASTCQQAVTLAGGAGALLRVFRGGTPQDIANTLDAAGKADADIRRQTFTLAGETGALQRVFEGSNPHAITNALDATSKTDPDTRRQVYATAERAGTLQRWIRSSADGPLRVDLHDLTHEAARDLLNHALTHHRRPGQEVTVITGRGTHRDDRRNPMADVASDTCRRHGMRVDQAPDNPGRLFAQEQGPAPAADVEEPAPGAALPIAPAHPLAAMAARGAPVADVIAWLQDRAQARDADALRHAIRHHGQALDHVMRQGSGAQIMALVAVAEDMGSGAGAQDICRDLLAGACGPRLRDAVAASGDAGHALLRRAAAASRDEGLERDLRALVGDAPQTHGAVHPGGAAGPADARPPLHYRDVVPEPGGMGGAGANDRKRPAPGDAMQPPPEPKRRRLPEPPGGGPAGP